MWPDPWAILRSCRGHDARVAMCAALLSMALEAGAMCRGLEAGGSACEALPLTRDQHSRRLVCEGLEGLSRCWWRLRVVEALQTLLLSSDDRLWGR